MVRLKAMLMQSVNNIDIDLSQDIDPKDTSNPQLWKSSLKVDAWSYCDLMTHMDSGH